MALPLIAFGAAGLTMLLGTKKLYDTYEDNEEADRNNKLAKNIEVSVLSKSKKSRKKSITAINALGKKKVEILDKTIKQYIDVFNKITNIELGESQGLQEASKVKENIKNLQGLKEMTSLASNLATGIGTGTVMGAITAFGAYGGVMTFGAASTGTAIATLSGAAATNATLAFLGGGSLAAGGLGVAGGTAVLGGLVAGPAIMVMGFYTASKAKANKDRAYTNLAKAREFEAEIEKAITLCDGITCRAKQLTTLLDKLNKVMVPLKNKVEEIVNEYGCDYCNYTIEQKKVLAASLSTASAIKAVIDVSLLTKKGTVTAKSKTVYDTGIKFLNSKGE